MHVCRKWGPFPLKSLDYLIKETSLCDAYMIYTQNSQQLKGDDCSVPYFTMYKERYKMLRKLMSNLSYSVILLTNDYDTVKRAPSPYMYVALNPKSLKCLPTCHFDMCVYSKLFIIAYCSICLSGQTNYLLIYLFRLKQAETWNLRQG